MRTSGAAALATIAAPDPDDSDSPPIDPLPDLTPEQYEALREDIRQRGVQTAVEVCAKTGEVLDGRARVRICGELKIRGYPRRVVSGLDTEEATQAPQAQGQLPPAATRPGDGQGDGPGRDAARAPE